MGSSMDAFSVTPLKSVMRLSAEMCSIDLPCGVSMNILQECQDC